MLLLQILRQRPALRVIISSATMNVAKLALFFTGANQHHLPPPPPAGTARQQHETPPSATPAVLSVQGRLYPVQEHFLKACSGFALSVAAKLAPSPSTPMLLTLEQSLKLVHVP